MMLSRNLFIAGVIVVIAVAAAVAIGMSVMKSGAGPGGVQLAANTKPAPAAAGQQAPPLQRMRLEAQYAGPLRDTIVQRWRDPVDGTVCYIYLPILVQHAPGPSGLVQYGPNGIGSISCLRTQ